MKFRFMLGFLVLVAGLTFVGFTAQPAAAQTVSGVELSAADRANIQSLLTATKTALDLVQVRVNQGAVENPAGMVSALNGIRTYLLSMQSFLGGSTQAAAPQATGPVASTPGPSAGQVAGEADQVAQSDGEAMTDEEDLDAMEDDVMMDDEGAMMEDDEMEDEAEDAGDASQWAFWIILIVAVVLAIVLARPRRNSGVMTTQAQRQQTPPADKPQEPQKNEQRTDKNQ